MPDPNRHEIDEPSPWIVADEKAHELARALRAGVREMRRLALKYKYMWPNPGEMEIVPIGDQVTRTVMVEGVGQVAVAMSQAGVPGYTRYELRVQRAAMPNAWARTIRSSARLPFRSRIQYDGWEPELQGVEKLDAEGKLVEKVPGWVDDVDGEGRSLDQWAAETFEDALFEGVVYGLADNDPREFPDPQSRRLAGARPYLTKIRRCDVKRISISVSPGGTPRITQFVFVQPIKSQDFSDPNAWVDEETDALKAITAGERLIDAGGRETLTPITTRVYVYDGKKYVHDPQRDGTIIPENGLPLIDIPLVPFYGKRTGPYRGESPYNGDSAELQVAVWNHMSELLNKARETSLTYLFESGLPTDEKGNARPINADSQTARYKGSTSPQADLKWVEQSAQSLKALWELIQSLLFQIEKEHHSIDSEKPTQPVTAREITLEGVHATSFLEMVLLFHEHGWQRVLELMATLGGHKKAGSREAKFGTVWISHNLGLPNTSMERNAEMCKAGKMTRGNYWNTALAVGDVNKEDGFDIQAEIDAEEGETEGLRELLTNLPPPAKDRAKDRDGEDEGEPKDEGEEPEEEPEDEGAEA
jgi:hypothetical protein